MHCNAMDYDERDLPVFEMEAMEQVELCVQCNAKWKEGASKLS